VLASATSTTETLLVVKNGVDEVFSINARGDVKTSGVIVVKDNSFAGSIATDANGEADIVFTYHLGTGKPAVQLTPESASPVFAQVVSWTQDNTGNYTGFKIKTFGLGGETTSSVVHYSVVGKQDGYATNGQVVVVENSNGGSIVPEGDTDGEGDVLGGYPVITINGNNPATINMGDVYNDLGASVTDDVDQNLAIYATVDGGAEIDISLISIDTASVGVHTIVYKATDSDGKVTTATRTVEVVDPNAVPETPESTPENEPELAPQEVPDGGSEAVDEGGSEVASGGEAGVGGETGDVEIGA
jgi:hypothetical protein